MSLHQIITPDLRDQYSDLIDSMHRSRYRVCIEQWGWDIPGAKPGYERDQFDTEHTVYIVVFDPAHHQVVGSTRLNPTTEPHMMSELFAHYCNLQPVPRSETTVECSRYVVDRSLYKDPLAEFRIRCSLGIGIAEYGLSNGIEQMSWLTHQKFFNLVQKQWKTEPLGLPVRETADGWAWVPAVSKIDAETYAQQRERFANAETIVAGMIARAEINAPSRAA